LFYRYDLINPYRRDYNNKQRLKVWFQEMVDNCTDPESVCKQVIGHPDYSYDEMFEDLVTIVVAGTETTSRTIVSCLYYLKKAPEKLQKLRDELKAHGFGPDLDFSKVHVDEILALEYLACVIKEGLRIDSPVVEVFNYYTYADIEICGVPIPKGTFIKPDLYSGHYDSERWLNTREFIPERHDPDSEHSKAAMAEGKKPHTYSRRSFGHGKRACPGQTLAYLKMRVVLTFLLSKMDYEILDGLIENDGVGFGAGSLIAPRFKITKL
jgi:cytochrome P450